MCYISLGPESFTISITSLMRCTNSSYVQSQLTRHRYTLEHENIAKSAKEKRGRIPGVRFNSRPILNGIIHS